MLENGKRNPSLKTIEKLATAYGMATWEFVKKLEDN
jgi:transcriptional regulator with XRE-family HTH domain